MIKNIIYTIINVSLFLYFFEKSIPVWFLFLILSIFYFLKLLKKTTIITPMKNINEIVYGVLDNYSVDADETDKSYGFYIELMKRPIFVDIKEDKFLDKRKEIALRMFENRLVLENNLNLFLANNHEFKAKSLNSIGLHSDNFEQAEVFWDPTGYTLLMLDRFEFASP